MTDTRRREFGRKEKDMRNYKKNEVGEKGKMKKEENEENK
jgi:hypothetical protein